MKRVINQTAGWSVLALGGLIVQDKFHGLDLGRWIVPVVVLLVVALIAFLVTWPWLLRHLAAELLTEMKVMQPELFEPRAVLAGAPAQGPMPEWEAVNERRADRIARANIQILTDEMATIVRLLTTMIKAERTTLDEDPPTEMWRNVKDSLLGIPDAHVPYRLTRDAYEALKKVRVGRIEPSELFNMTEREVAERHDVIRAIIREFEDADRAWLNYLNDH